MFGSNREAPLRTVAEALAAVAPERGVELARQEFGDRRPADRVWARAAVAAARTRSAGVDRHLGPIRDAELRTATEAGVIEAVAERDLPEALRLAGEIGGRERTPSPWPGRPATGPPQEIRRAPPRPSPSRSGPSPAPGGSGPPPCASRRPDWPCRDRS